MPVVMAMPVPVVVVVAVAVAVPGPVGMARGVAVTVVGVVGRRHGGIIALGRVSRPGDRDGVAVEGRSLRLRTRCDSTSCCPCLSISRCSSR